MPLLLTVSADLASTSRVEAIANDLHFMNRSVSSLESAREWLEIENFEVLLVDSRYGEGPSLDLLTLGWRFNQFMVCGLFNFYGKVENEWQARLVGAHVFSGNKANDLIATVIKSIPKSFNTDSSSVLLVEDLDSPRLILSSYVEGLGLGSVDAVRSGQEALDCINLNDRKYYCILTDVNMPEMTGIDLLHKIRHTTNLKHIPVIMLTSYGTSDNLVKCLEEGATGFLVKPPLKRTLRQELEKAKRILITKQSPRLCNEDDVHLLNDILANMPIT